MTLNTLMRVTRRLYDHPANRNHRLGALGRFAGWQLYKRLTGRSVDLRVFDGKIVLRCYPNSASASAVLYAHQGLTDYHEMRFMRHYLRPGDGFLDIGANIGVYTLFSASIVGPQGHIMAFEPGEQAYARLREHVLLNRLESNVESFAVALGDHRGAAAFTQGLDSTNHIVYGHDDARQQVSHVPCARLDDLVPAERRFAMGKMDVEGAELLVLSGAQQMLSAGNPPVWLLEVNGRLRNYGLTERQLENWLAERGYFFALYDSERRELLRGSNLWEKAGNLFAIHADHLDEVTERLETLPGAQRA